MAKARPSDPSEPDDPTFGGAIPDPNDTSPRARFNRGEIPLDELNRLLADELGATPADPPPDAS